MSKAKQYMIALLISVIAISVVSGAVWLDNKKKEEVARENEKREREYYEQQEKIELDNKQREENIKEVAISNFRKGYYIGEGLTCKEEYGVPTKVVQKFIGTDGNSFKACISVKETYKKDSLYSVWNQEIIR